jgi:hypothetical protein
MNWKDVGSWLKGNAGTGAVLVGSLLTGNIPGAVAAGVSLVTSVTGETEPSKVLASLQGDPATLLKLRELAVQEEASIRGHIQAMEELRLMDLQAEHAQTQSTIRSGDQAEDPYVRHTRPLMARQSWYATVAYVFAFEALHLAGVFSAGAVLELAMLLVAPAAAYIGFRTLDKRSVAAAVVKRA